MDDIIENLTGYLEARIELLKLDAKNEATRIAVNVAVWSIVGFFALLTTICLTVALGLWLGDLVESRPLGFVLAALFFLVLSGILIGSKMALQHMVQRRVFPKYKS